MDAKGCLPYRYFESQACSDENAKAVPRNRLRFLDFGMSFVPSPALSLETLLYLMLAKLHAEFAKVFALWGGKAQTREAEEKSDELPW